MSIVRMPGSAMDFPLDQEAILKSLNLNPRDPKTQALLLICDRYNLDPILKHLVLISGNPYVTRDGLLHVAHRTGQLDGIEVVDCGEYETHYWAKVAVYRKDMGRPFTYVGRFAKNKPMAKEYGPEMAIKTAEVAALRRAFSVTGLPAAMETLDGSPAMPVGEDVEQPAITTGSTAASEPFPGAPPDVPPLAAAEERTSLVNTIAALNDSQRKALVDLWKEAGLPAISMAGKFTIDDIAKATGFIEQVKATALDPERPFDPPSTTDQLPLEKRLERLTGRSRAIYRGAAAKRDLPIDGALTAEQEAEAHRMLDELDSTGKIADPA